jgi:hypothetical protein
MEDDENITIGRNTRCDSYLHLVGKKQNQIVSGVYVAFGLSHRKELGRFHLSKVVS